MEIVSKPMLKRQITAFRLYVEYLEKLKGIMAVDPLTPGEDDILETQAELDASLSMIQACKDELKNKHGEN